ncbi:MAG: GNAT family N-acetyltransferase [Thermoleophilaceae bacterium]
MPGCGCRGHLLHDEEELTGPGFTLRRATPSDAQELARCVGEGFAGYRSFAPPGWQPPAEVSDPEPIAERLRDPEVWAMVAELEGELAGHVSFVPARSSRWGSPDASLAHLWQLFVRAQYWGSGVAATLHGAAVAEAADRGFTSIRLYTPAGQARARRFYEREGWTTRGAPFLSQDLGLKLVEYRRPLVA